MSPLEPGTLVCLIHGDDDAMPVGAVGEVLNGPDWMDDYDVEFPGHPCPVPPGTFWVCNKAWLVPVGKPSKPKGAIRTLCDDITQFGWQP
jgi:hypothetical protein